MIKELETIDGDIVVKIHDDEDHPVVLDGKRLSQENIKALKAWLDASIKLQRWC